MCEIDGERRQFFAFGFKFTLRVYNNYFHSVLQPVKVTSSDQQEQQEEEI
jgi:hypothetical protein